MADRGDFNELADNNELSYGCTSEHSLLESFHHLMEDCELADLGFVGAAFTWRKSSSPKSIQARLDTCLSTSEWGALYPRAKIFHLEFWNSDHRPLFLSTEAENNFNITVKPRSSFFEEAWCEEEECGERVRQDWVPDISGASLPSLLDSLHQCKESLSRWGRGKKNELDFKIEKQKEVVRKVRDKRPGLGYGDLGREVRQLDALPEKEERFWRQRSRMAWMKCGDKNMSLFHRRASARKKRTRFGVFSTSLTSGSRGMEILRGWSPPSLRRFLRPLGRARSSLTRC